MDAKDGKGNGMDGKNFVILCPACTRGNEPSRKVCALCGADVRRRDGDSQRLLLEDITDGYHSWYSQPTAYHRIYRCVNYPGACAGCLHLRDGFCVNGRVDVRDLVTKE